MWSWLESAKQFVFNLTNRILGRDGERSVGSANIAANESAVSGVTEMMLTDQITVFQWESAMREALKDGYIQQYLLGRGGMAQLTFADYGSIGGMLGEQYKYLSGFAAEIAAGDLTPGQIRMRAAMYARSSRESYERAKGRAYGIPEGLLPSIPGRGDTRCLTNCGCFWDIEDVFDDQGNFEGWNCTWVLNPALENCPDCQDNADQWNPLFIPAPVTEEA